MIADEIREKIAHVEQQPQNRLNRLRLNGLRVLLARYEREKGQDQ